VTCHGEGEEGLALSSSNLPSSISSITLSRIMSLTIKNNTFSGQDKLKKVTIEDCEIDELASESLFSESHEFRFINNKIGVIKSKAFTGHSNMFNFSGNEITKIESNAFSISFLISDISRNIFHSPTSSLFSLTPSPACVPDETAYDYGDIEYRVVASPALSFQANSFPQFSLDMLHFPAIRNIPLGSLVVRANTVPCDCNTVQELALLADFDHLDLQGDRSMNTDLGDLVFKKEFYSTSNCVLENGKQLRLKKFARSWIEVTKTGIKCTNPEERKKRLAPKKNIEDASNSVLADEPHTEKVKKDNDGNMRDISRDIPNKKVPDNTDSSTASCYKLFVILLLFCFII